MKIGVIRLSKSPGVLEGGVYYNLQCVGLGKALAQLGHTVGVYRCIYGKGEVISKKVSENLTIYELPVKGIGQNGILNLKAVGTDFDVIVMLSDVQIDACRVIKYYRKKGILFIPYIGVLNSHSTNALIRLLINVTRYRLFNEYKKGICLAKTPEIVRELLDNGVNNAEIMAVGLDQELLCTEYGKVKADKLKSELGFSENERIILFIGRLTEEKHPERMIEVFRRIAENHSDTRLVMIGQGELKEGIRKLTTSYGLDDRISMIDGVPNSEIWKYYRISECFVNLNIQEIFGMALLESMYYECPVIACHAPGPDFIIDDGADGYLVSTDDEIVDRIVKCINKDTFDLSVAHNSILEKFIWEATVQPLIKIIDR